MIDRSLLINETFSLVDDPKLAIVFVSPQQLVESVK